jgi:hypothetical protein
MPQHISNLNQLADHILAIEIRLGMIDPVTGEIKEEFRYRGPQTVTVTNFEGIPLHHFNNLDDAQIGELFASRGVEVNDAKVEEVKRTLRNPIRLPEKQQKLADEANQERAARQRQAETDRAAQAERAEADRVEGEQRAQELAQREQADAQVRTNVDRRNAAAQQRVIDTRQGQPRTNPDSGGDDREESSK